MARRSQCSSAGDNPLHPNYLPPHYREEYRLAIDALVEEDLEGYYQFLQKADVVDFLSTSEIHYIQESVQAPQQSNLPEHRFLEMGGDGSSDTYWPIHSDLDAPGLDLGWPQLHSFIGPTEVTTLVNPPEPDMPSIKEQARRLIKNAHQVIAIVMDMFTDVDIFHDILNAAMRNVAVYVLLDELNVHHFLNMVSNCRVNLQSVQFLRVRTVSGITYHCRSGKSFKGQMMDRFILTDCRAVLSGNYSFMWSFEKLHRCLAHLFLGQLVSTFDEEFRILFAQSQPLVAENVLPPVEDFSLVPKRQYPSDRTALYRDPRKFRSADTPEEWARHPGDERMEVDWRMMPLKKKEPSDIYRFPSQQPRMDPSFDQGPSRMPPMDSAFKRHAEGGHGRFSYPFLQQQGMPEPETQGRPYGWQQPFQGPGQGKEADYSAYDKFWNQGYQSSDQYPEPGLPPEMDSSDNFDPVLNYLSTTRNVDFDQGSTPAAELPFTSSHPQRLTLGKQYPCQTSPAPSNPSEQKHFFQEPTTDRKDPLVKRGLRDWRISSYLSTYDNPEDEGLPLPPSNESDPFEGPSNPPQQTMPGIELSDHKIPNVRQFKIPAIPRVSQLPGYAKTAAREPPKKHPDEPTAAVEIRTTPSPSESSSTADGEKTEEQEQRETKPAVVHRDESFRRKYNMNVARSSRLRSSLIFNSLDQQQTAEDAKSASDQQDEESDKNEPEQNKLSFVSQVLGQRRSTTRGPFEWSRYIKSGSLDNSNTDSSKPDDGNDKTGDTESSKDKENSKDLSVKQEGQDISKPLDVEQSKPSEEELPKTDQPIKPPMSLFSSPMYVDMNDPDARLMFFKELAAKRKAAKAAEAEKKKEKAPMKPPVELKSKDTDKKDEPEPQEATEKTTDGTTSEDLTGKNAPAENAGKAASTEACKTDKQENRGENDPNLIQSFKEEQSRVSADSETLEPVSTQPAATPPVAGEPEVPTEQQKPSSPAEEKSSPSHPPAPINTPADEPSLAQDTGEDKNQCQDSLSKESSSHTPSSVKTPPSSAVASLDPNIPNPESVQLEAPPPLSKQHTGTELSSPRLSTQSSPSEHVQPDSSGSQISPSPSPSSSAPLSSPAETTSSNVSQEDPSSTPTPSILSPNVPETGTCALEESSQESPALSISQTESGANPAQPESVADSTSLESDISPESAAGLDPNTSSLQSSEKGLPENENSSDPEVVEAKSDSFESSKDITTDKTPPSISPHSLPELCLHSGPDVTDKSQNVVTSPSPSSAGSPLQCLADTSSPVHSDLAPDASQTDTPASSLDAPAQVSPTSEPTLTETASYSPDGSGEGYREDFPSQSDESPQLTSAEISSPTDPTSGVQTEIDLPESPKSVSSEYRPSDSPVPAENSQTDESKQPEMPDPDEKEADDTETTNKINQSVTQESTCSEKTDDQVKPNSDVTSDEVAPLSPQSKQPKSSQSRYLSSTANVLSSSNLRDDTKLLLGQISANSQSRNESSKESPVADDEKEDEDDKNVKSEKERGFRSLSRNQPKSSEEREKLLERIQSMRKERKVYSRFEMAP